MPEMRYRKEAAVDVDLIGDDLILMHLVSRRMIILNPTGTILWDALDTFPTRASSWACSAKRCPISPQPSSRRAWPRCSTA